MSLILPSAGLPPPGFPRMTAPPLIVDALAWYDKFQHADQLAGMQYEARDEVVDLTYPHPTNPNLRGVPRTLAPNCTQESDKRAYGKHVFEASFTSDLRAEQVPFVDEAYHTLETDQGGIGEAPTGFGKTTTGCWLTANIGRTTCIVIPKGDLDWTGELLAHTNIPKERIDTWQGGKLPDPSAWVVVAMLQSIYRNGVYPQEIYNRFACVIFDEVHRLGAPEFSAAIRKFPAVFRLGLSATADRRDGKMDLIHSHIGWRHVIGHTDAEQPDYYVIGTEWSEPHDKKGKRIAFDPSRTNAAKKDMMKDPVRNARIAAALLRAHKGNRRTIVFIEQLAHGEQLEKALVSMGVPKASIVQYNGSAKKEARDKAKACEPGIILLATYKFTAEGTNIPPLDTCCFAHPIYDPRQPVGRITRKHPGKPKPVVLDVWDHECGSLRSMATKRWEFLRKLGATWKGEFK